MSALEKAGLEKKTSVNYVHSASPQVQPLLRFQRSTIPGSERELKCVCKSLSAVCHVLERYALCLKIIPVCLRLLFIMCVWNYFTQRKQNQLGFRDDNSKKKIAEQPVEAKFNNVWSSLYWCTFVFVLFRKQTNDVPQILVAFVDTWISWVFSRKSQGREDIWIEKIKT